MRKVARRIIERDPRACARAITLIEADEPEGYEILEEIEPYRKDAVKIGITGPPGAGKSTLVDALISHLRKKEKRIGMLAVDPTSPFTGGAILGDRIRMQRHATDPEVFIRSMGTRGNLGGLSRHTRHAMRILEAYGSEVILVETVGVGQSEVQVMNVADTILLLLTPEGGDLVQAFKAGIMEIADLFIVNKADLPGAERLISHINALLDVTQSQAGWRPPVIKTVGTTGEGIEEIWEKVLLHRTYLEQNREGRSERDVRREELREILREMMDRFVEEALASPSLEQLVREVEDGRRSPYQGALTIMERLREGGMKR